MTNEIQRLETEIMPVVERAREFVVATAEDCNAAIEYVKIVKHRIARVHEVCDPICDAANKTHKLATRQRKDFLSPLEAAEKTLKKSALTWQQAEEEKRLAEERRLQAIADEKARKAREKIEQAEAKQRAIEEAAREKERAAREAAAAAENEAERKRLEKEAAKLARRAAAAKAKAETKREDAAAVVAPVVEIAPVAKTEGVSIRKTWKARLVDKAALIQAAATDRMAASFLEFDQSAANKIAASTKGTVPYPGIEFYTESGMSVRKGK